MQQTTDGAIVTRLGRILASISASRVTTVLYYLAVLLGLVVLYGRGEFSTAGFIYQAF